MCARVTSTYMEFTFTFGPKPEFKFSFKLFLIFPFVHIITSLNANICLLDEINYNTRTNVCQQKNEHIFG